MITLVYHPTGGLVLPDGEVWAWADALVRGGDSVVKISQIDLFSVARAAACANGNPEDLFLVTEEGELAVNKYGAYHGPHPEPPGSKAAMEVIEYARKKRKYEMEVYPWADISPEDKAAIDARIRSFAVQGWHMGIRIEAIRFLRHHVDLSLTEAKRYVDDEFDAYAKALMEEDCPNDMIKEHVKALWDTNKIEAIKWVRNRYNMTLREAKDRTEGIVLQ